MQTTIQKGELSYEGRKALEINIHHGEQLYDLSHQAPAYERISVGMTVNRQIRVSYYINGHAVKHNDFHPESCWVEVQYQTEGQ